MSEHDAFAWDMWSGDSQSVTVGRVGDKIFEVVGLSFHPDSVMMAACACGFTVHSFGSSHARANYRLASHQRRCQARLICLVKSVLDEIRAADTPELRRQYLNGRIRDTDGFQWYQS